jgi:magnesium transporter
VSSRLYQEEGAYFMTATILVGTDTREPSSTPISFILAGRKLITVRYAQPRAFSIFLARAKRSDANFTNGGAVLVGLIDAIVHRLADFIERVQVEVSKLSHSIFEMRGSTASRERRFDALLKSIGREGEMTSGTRKRLLARTFAHVPLPCCQRAQRGQAWQGAHSHRRPGCQFAD